MIVDKENQQRVSDETNQSSIPSDILEEMKEYAGVMLYLYHCAKRGVEDREYMRRCLCKMAMVLDQEQLKILINSLVLKLQTEV